MFSAKWLPVAAAVVLIVGSVAMATLYVWIGGTSGNWDDETQWCNPPTPACLCLGGIGSCYPHTTDDDAVIDTGRVTITLENNRVIEDLTVSDGDEFTPTITTDDGSAKSVTCDSVTVTGSGLTVTNKAAVLAEGSEPCGK